MPRLLPLFLVAAATLRADPPRPADFGDGWKVEADVRLSSGTGDSGRKESSSAVRLEALSHLTNIGDWRLSLTGGASAEAHDWKGPALPAPYEYVRELDIGLAAAQRPDGKGGPARFLALELGTRTADDVEFQKDLTVSFVGGSTWKMSETFDLGFLVIAETRRVENDLLIVVPTFRWAFAPDWSLATGRKALVLGHRLTPDSQATFSIGYTGEETRVQPVGGANARVLDERLVASAGYAWEWQGWQVSARLGWELDSELSFQVDGQPEAKVDPGQGLHLGLTARIRM